MSIRRKTKGFEAFKISIEQCESSIEDITVIVIAVGILSNSSTIKPAKFMIYEHSKA
jgi:hypothetical protein